MMRKHPLPLLAAALLALPFAVAARAASPPTGHSALVERDLGRGLAYFRAHLLPADLPPAAVATGPIVLDLRFAAAENPAAATALDAWLRFRATPDTPVFVLLNAETAPALRHVFATAKPRAGLLTLGPVLADFKPDIAIAAPADTERRAYDALEHGATVASLITENADKPRADEAALVLERTNPPDDSAAADDDDADPAADAKPAAAAPAAPPLIDHSLRRAIQLDRALLALKRL